MTKENARLRRQALILSYLPDPVIAIRADGVITFCSMQVERVLRHDVSDLVGANIEDILVPNSRESIRRLISDLVLAEQRASMSEDDDLEEINRENRCCEQEDDMEDVINLPHEVSEGGGSSDDKTPQPPLLEVKVKADSTEVGVGEDVSDSSGDDKNKKSSETSSLTQKMDSGEDKTMTVANTEEKPTTSATEESDESSSTANKANANLLKNVEMSKLNNEGCDGQGINRFSHKDDVMGASVTANNADAKLSSLMHHIAAASAGDKLSSSTNKKHQHHEEEDQEQVTSSADSSSRHKTKKRSGNSSDDSGYRQSPEESNEYLEDSLSSSEASTDRSSSKKKRELYGID